MQYSQVLRKDELKINCRKGFLKFSIHQEKIKEIVINKVHADYIKLQG